MKYDVFISYSTQDQQTASKIFQALTDAGISCWMSKSRLAAGATWDDEIADALTNSRSMVCVLTKAANDSLWVRNEIAEALDSGMIVLPYLAQSFELSGGLRLRLKRLQWIDSTRGPTDGLPELIEALRSMTGSTTEVEEIPQPEPEPPTETDLAEPESPPAEELENDKEILVAPAPHKVTRDASQPPFNWKIVLYVLGGLIAWYLVILGVMALTSHKKPSVTKKEDKSGIGLSTAITPPPPTSTGELDPTPEEVDDSSRMALNNTSFKYSYKVPSKLYRRTDSETGYYRGWWTTRGKDTLVHENSLTFEVIASTDRDDRAAIFFMPATSSRVMVNGVEWLEDRRTPAFAFSGSSQVIWREAKGPWGVVELKIEISSNRYGLSPIYIRIGDEILNSFTFSQ